MNRTFLLLLAVVLVAFLWFSNRQQAADDEQREIVEREQPELLGEDIEFSQLHEDGKLHYRLRALSISQFSENKLTRMNDPRLHLRSATQPPWDVNSKEGFIRSDETADNTREDVVYLRHSVRMRQVNPVNGKITLRSESIYLYPDRQFAETQQDVIIDTEVGRTTAAGLVADLENGIIDLSSSATQRVHTIVLPEQFKSKQG